METTPQNGVHVYHSCIPLPVKIDKTQQIRMELHINVLFHLSFLFNVSDWKIYVLTMAQQSNSNMSLVTCPHVEAVSRNKCCNVSK